MKRKRRSKKNTRVWPVVLAAVIITLIALTALFGPDLSQHLHSRNTQNELRDMYRSGIDTGKN